MECDEELSISTEVNQHPIVNEARAVYKQLKTLCASLKSVHDDDSGLLNFIL